LANKSKRKNKKQDKKEAPVTNDPWIGKQTGLLAMVVLTIGFAAFMTWQLIPSEGFGGLFCGGLVLHWFYGRFLEWPLLSIRGCADDDSRCK